MKTLLTLIAALFVTSAFGVSLSVKTQPKSIIVNAGSTATFSVVTTNGTVTGYQWYVGKTALQDGTTNGAIVSGSQTATLTIENVGTNLNAGLFKVVVTGGAIPLNSLAAKLTVVQGTLVKFDVPGTGTMIVELFDHDKPVTVQNFLRYVQSGYSGFTNFYANNFFSRLEQNFVLQGGGFAPYPLTNATSPFTNVYNIADAALNTLEAVGGGLLWYINNESAVGPHIRNTFGTLAMATPTGYPNRARSEWFFNLADNSGAPHDLDTNNGGYTVFGRVIQGSDVLNAFNNLPTSQIISNQVTSQITDTIYGTNTFPTLPVKTTDANNVHVGDLFSVNISFVKKPASIDLIRPTLKITYPPPNAKLTNTDITLRGTSTDGVGVAGVYCQDLYYHAVGPDDLDDDEVLLQRVPVTGTTNWSADVHLFPGPWVLIMTAYDGHGNWLETSENFVIESPLTVVTNGIGKIIPSLNGQWLAPQTRYSMTAVPGPGQLFAYWSGERNGQPWMFPFNDKDWAFFGTNSFKSGPQLGPKVMTPKLTFTMYTNLTLTANFVSNYFPSVFGTYYGLMAPTDHNTITVSNSGLCKITSTTVGSFSGTLTMPGTLLSFVGKWDYSGNANNISIPRRGMGPLTMSLSIDLSNNLGAITGTVSSTNWTADIQAYRQVTTKLSTNTIPATHNYVLTFPSQPTNSDLGDSFATVGVSPLGLLTISGSMSDNTSWTESAGVSKEGKFPIFASLYTGKGLIIGAEDFTQSAVAQWIRPAISNANYAKGFDTGEFPNGLMPYSRPATNIQFSLQFGGNTLSQQTFAIQAGKTGQFIISGNTGNKLKLVLITTTGALSGSWLDATNGLWTLKGVFINNDTGGTGFIIGPHGQTGYLRIVPPA